MTPEEGIKDDDWTPDEVERRARSGGVMTLVIHKSECNEGEINAGPRISRALEVLPQTHTEWLILVPVAIDAALDGKEHVSVKTAEGSELTVPRGRFTSDLRMVQLALLTAVEKASEK
jgi:hypothetical protein